MKVITNSEKMRKMLPPQKYFVNTVKQLRVLEQMTDSIQLQKDLGERQWQKWVVYVDRVCMWFTYRIICLLDVLFTPGP